MSAHPSSKRLRNHPFTRQVAEALHQLSATDQRIVVGVSGGPDSTALLLALTSSQSDTRAQLTAAHANHALRGPESDADETFLRELCDRLAVPLECRRLPVPSDPDERGEGIEEMARNLRQSFYVEVSARSDARFVATAHTADDHIETILHRIVRGTGLDGLAGIPRSRALTAHVRLIRPILGLRRHAVLEFLSDIGQDFREDCSNRDLRFTRNRLRHELLPYLEEHFNPRVAEAITRLGAFAEKAQSLIHQQVKRLGRRVIVEKEESRVVLDTARLQQTPTYLIGELIRSIWAEQSWPLQEVGQDQLQRVTELINGEAKAWDMPGGVRAERTRRHIVFVQSPV